MAFERALAKQPKTDVPDGARCYVCLDGGDVLRGCACRGPSAGFAHAGCLAEMAARDEWMMVEGFGWLSRWIYCGTCHQEFVGAQRLEMVRRVWRHRRDTPGSIEKDQALTTLTSALLSVKEFAGAERLYEEAWRDVPDDDDHAYGPRISSEIMRAGRLTQAGRSRDALEILTRLRPRLALCHVVNRADFNTCMSAALANVGRVEEALPFASDAVDIARTCHGPQSESALDAMFVQAQLLSSVGRVEEAKSMLGHIVAARTRLLGHEHQSTRGTRDVLRRITAQTG